MRSVACLRLRLVIGFISEQKVEIIVYNYNIAKRLTIIIIFADFNIVFLMMMMMMMVMANIGVAWQVVNVNTNALTTTRRRTFSSFFLNFYSQKASKLARLHQDAGSSERPCM